MRGHVPIAPAIHPAPSAPPAPDVRLPVGLGTGHDRQSEVDPTPPAAAPVDTPVSDHTHKRILELEKENARLKKRQRRAEEEVRELRLLLVQALTQPTTSTTSSVPRQLVATSLSSAVVSTACPRPTFVHFSEEHLRFFPFLRDYAMGEKRFVADDLRKPAWVFLFPGPCKPYVTFANTQLCPLVGYSQEEVLAGDLIITMDLAEKTRIWPELHSPAEAMRVSEVHRVTSGLLHKSGDMLGVELSCQFFFGPAGKMRCAVVCVERVLGKTGPPWACQGTSSRRGEGEHMRLMDYMGRWVEKENLEWACAGASFWASSPEALAGDESSARDSPFSFPSSLFC